MSGGFPWEGTSTLSPEKCLSGSEREMSESQWDPLMVGREKAQSQGGEAGSALWGVGPAGPEGKVTPCFLSCGPGAGALFPGSQKSGRAVLGRNALDTAGLRYQRGSQRDHLECGTPPHHARLRPQAPAMLFGDPTLRGIPA